MDINRFQTLVTTTSFLNGGDTVENPTLAEILYFRKDSETGRPIAGTYLAIIASADKSTADKALNDAISAPAPATMREAATMVPRIHAISVGSLFRTYESRLADGSIATLRHSGTLSEGVRQNLHEGGDLTALQNEFNVLLNQFINWRQQQQGGQQQGGQQQGGFFNGQQGGQQGSAPTQTVTILCITQTRILTKRGNIAPFLDYNLQ